MQSGLSAHAAGLRGAVITGVNAAREDTELAARQTKLLENRLESAHIKLNEAVGRNKLLRDEIDNLRRERCVFDQACSKGVPRCAVLRH